MIDLRMGDCSIEMGTIPDKSIDVILTDPPYLYMDHKLDRSFDEDIVFNNFKRILKKDGFLVIFGRGESFYRWNYKLNQLGFKFKESIVWNKMKSSSPLLSLQRVHEDISIMTLGNGKINRVKIEYLEAKNYDLDTIIKDIKSLIGHLKNNKNINEIVSYLDEGKINYYSAKKKHNLTIRDKSVKTELNKSVSMIRSMNEGMNEKSIISISREMYKDIHPTQKPIKLLIRLLNLVSKPNDLIFDPFAGSGSSAIACINTQRNFIGFEIDPEYYQGAISRINEAQRQTRIQM